MANLDTNKVVYVEPNANYNLNTAYQVDYGYVPKSPDPEDFCIIVDLEVEVKGRTFYYSKKSSDTTTRMEVKESTSGQEIRFFQGSKIYTDASRTNYINSLTTNYTDCTWEDIKKGGTGEMFGVKSIDISYNSFMVPQVTIQFVDVRGVSLFAQEEYRHNITKDGMDGIANNDIEGSFFKCFFTFPYPKFTLRVKGFYGQMVSYELTASDFRAAFDSQTGNFNVVAKFVGYAFSFLGDVMTNALVAAPYSEYLGSQYWNDNVSNGKFKIKNLNGNLTDMVRLGKICEKYKVIQEEAKRELETEGTAALMKKSGRFTQKEIDNAKVPDLSNIRRLYDDGVSSFRQYGETSEDGQRNVIHGDGNSVCIITDDNDLIDKLTGVMESFKAINDEMLEDKEAQSVKSIQYWFHEGGHKFEILHFSDWEALSIHGDEGDTQIKPGALDKSETKLIRNIENKAKDNNHKWMDDDNSEFFIYQDCGLEKLLNSEKELTEEEAKELKKNTDELEAWIEREKFAKAFDFAPTIENITKIIMAHFETYVYMIATCAKDIINGNAKRSEGISLDNFDDVVKNSENESNITIPPFPSVTKEVTDVDGNEKREDEWIGNFGNSSQFEEISLIEGLLAGIESAATDINEAAAAVGSSNGSDNVHCVVSNPICVADLVLKNEGDNPFGEVNMADTNDIFAHVAMRGYSAIVNMNSDDISTSSLGTYDATNFFNIYEKDSNIETLKNALKGGITGSDLIDYFKGDNSKAPNKGAKNSPWSIISKALFYHPENRDENDMLACKAGVIQPDDTGRLFTFNKWKFDDLRRCSKKNKLTRGNLIRLYGTPTNNEDTTTTYNPINIGKKRVKYLKNAMGSESSGLFSTYAFNDERFKNQYLRDEMSTQAGSETVYVAVPKYGEKEKHDTNVAKDVVVYDEDGGVSNAHEINRSFQNVFYNPDYYECSTTEEKAYFFLTNAFSFNGTNTITDAISQNKSGVVYAPHYALLLVGAELARSSNNNYGGHKRGRNKAILKNHFSSWVKTGFKKIQNAYELKFDGTSTFSKMCAHITENTPNGDITSAIFEACPSFKEAFVANSIVSGSQPFGSMRVPKVYNLCSDAMAVVLDDLLCVCDVCVYTRYNDLDNYPGLSKGGPIFTKSQLESYLTSFIDGMKDKLGVSDDSQESNNKEVIDNDPDDIKVGVYNYIKMLYDKWISSDLDSKEYTMGVMFDGSNPIFHFVDSVYNKIGSSYYINIGTLVSMLVKSQVANGYTLLSMMSDMYAANKYLFLCLQNFADMADPDMLETMFKPVPYIEAKEPSNHPNFVVIYPGEASSKLDIKDGDYPDDGYMLNKQADWPQMIRDKKEGYPIPAFGVSYGQQYQSYFKNIQVDMNSPMTTEQSLKAKFLLCGASTSSENNGPRQITAGQDLYTIYANNSYTCTVTMMGCAWVQPMMYFVLLNVPMFKGTYMITKVQHAITPGNMETTFTGVRMARTMTRAVREYIMGINNDSYNSANNGEGVSDENNHANIGCDCEYAFYTPTSAGGSGVDFSGDLNQKLICNLPKGAIDIATYDGGYFKDWTIKQALSAIAVQEFNGTSQAAIDNRIAVMACMYNWRGVGKDRSAYKKLIFKSAWNYFMNKNIVGRLSNVAKKYNSIWEQAQQELENVFKNGPYKYLKGKQNLLTDAPITVSEIQKGMHTAGTSDGKNRDSLIAQWGSIQYELPPVNGYYHIITGDKDCPDGFVPPEETKEETKKDEEGNIGMDSLASGFTQAVQSSLNATSAYKTAVVKADYGKSAKTSRFIRLVGAGDNATNALFDCIQDQYMDYWDKLYWCKGNGNMNNDAICIVVRVVSSKPNPKDYTMGVIDDYNISDNDKVKVLPITKEDELNKSLQLIMIKHFKKNNITTPQAAKKRFTSINNMDDALVAKLFELNYSGKSQVDDCNTAMGGDSAIEANIPPVTKNGHKFDRAKASEWIEKNSYDSYSEKLCGHCAKRVREAINVGGIATPNNPHNANGYVEYLPAIGFGLIATLKTKQEQDEWTKSSAEVGDLAVMQYYKDGHICMFTHKNRWVSDFKQNQMAANRNKKGTCYVYRFA